MSGADEAGLRDRLKELKDRLEEAEGTLQLKDGIIKGLAPKAVARTAKLEALRDRLGLLKFQHAYMRYVTRTSSGDRGGRTVRPQVPIVDIMVAAEGLPCTELGGATVPPSAAFRIVQSSRPVAYESEVVSGRQPRWKRCQFSAAKLNFAEDLEFEVVDMSTGISDVLCSCKLPILQMLLMGGDHTVPLEIPDIKRRITKKSKEAPVMIFRHFAVSGNRQAPTPRKSIFEQSGVDLLNPKRSPKGLVFEDYKSSPPEKAPLPERVATETLSLEDQVKREEMEAKERRRQRMSLMQAVFACSKRFVLFEQVTVKGKGSGMIASKLVESGPNAGKHRIRLTNGRELFAHPNDLEQAQRRPDPGKGARLAV